MKKFVALLQLPFVAGAVSLLVICGIVPPDELVRVLAELMSESGRRWIAALKKPASDKKQLPPVPQDAVPVKMQRELVGIVGKPPAGIRPVYEGDKSEVTQVVRSRLPKVDPDKTLKDDAVAIAEQQARVDAKDLGMGAKTTMRFVEEVGQAVAEAMPKSATELFELEGPNLEKAIAASVQSPPRGVVQQQAKPAVASCLPKVDTNAKTVAKPSVQQGDVSPAEVLRMQAEFARNEGHLDPRPTVAKGIDVLAIAEAEIAARRASAASQGLNVERPRICYGDEWLDAEDARKRFAWVLFQEASKPGEPDVKAFYATYLPKVEAIPVFAEPWNERFCLVFLTDPTLLTPQKALKLAGVKGGGRQDLDTREKIVAYWSCGQPGDTYFGESPYCVLDGLEGKDEKVLTVLEAACMLIQYPLAISKVAGSGLECMGEDGKLFTIMRREDGSLDIAESDIYSAGDRIGTATRGSTTGIIDMSDLRIQ